MSSCSSLTIFFRALRVSPLPLNLCLIDRRDFTSSVCHVETTSSFWSFQLVIFGPFAVIFTDLSREEIVFSDSFPVFFLIVLFVLFILLIFVANQAGIQEEQSSVSFRYCFKKIILCKSLGSRGSVQSLQDSLEIKYSCLCENDSFLFLLFLLYYMFILFSRIGFVPKQNKGRCQKQNIECRCCYLYLKNILHLFRGALQWKIIRQRIILFQPYPFLLPKWYYYQ